MRSTPLTLLALSLASFAIGTGEFSVMGLLPQIADDLHVELTTAGAIVSSYALGVVVGAPLLAVATARAARHRLVVAFLAVIAAGNLASALAPDHQALIALRFATALPHGAFFGVASLIAAELAGPGRRAQAVGRTMLGLTVAGIIGTPLAVVIGQVGSWRVAYVVIAAIAAAACALFAAVAPPMPASATASPRSELGALLRPQVWLTLGIGSVGFGGLFAIYTYIAPTLTDLAGTPPAGVPYVVALIGLGMVIGNLVGGRLADRSLTSTIAGALAWNLVVTVAFALVAHVAVLAAVCALAIGCGFALVPALQTRLMDVAEDAQTLAASLNHSAFNVANAIGAGLGGVAVARGGWSATGWVGAGMALAGAGLFAASLALARISARRLPGSLRTTRRCPA
jgi:MFS transporter, DHA1 family, inner membrane transport protein